jgi:hypothetical protein
LYCFKEQDIFTDLLARLNLLQHLGVFIRHGFDLRSLVHADVTDLAGLGIAEDDCVRILKGIRQWEHRALLSYWPDFPDEMPIDQWLATINLAQHAPNFDAAKYYTVGSFREVLAQDWRCAADVIYNILGDEQTKKGYVLRIVLALFKTVSNYSVKTFLLTIFDFLGRNIQWRCAHRRSTGGAARCRSANRSC